MSICVQAVGLSCSHILQIALVQIAVEYEREDKRLVQAVYLIHVAQMSRFPTALSVLLADASIVKAGRSVGGDFAKLQRDWNVACMSSLELGSLCRTRGLVPKGNVGLAALCAEVLREQLPKNQDARLSRWDQPLNEQQMIYAAADAWASLRIAHAALLQPDHAARLTPETAVPNIQVDFMVATVRVATGEIIEADQWYGVPCVPERRSTKLKVVVRIDYVYNTAAKIPCLPSIKAIPENWPDRGRNARGRRVRPTIGEVRNAFQDSGPFTLLLLVSSLRPHIP